MFGRKKKFTLDDSNTTELNEAVQSQLAFILLIERAKISLVAATTTSNNELLLSAPESLPWNKDNLDKQVRQLIEGYEPGPVHLIIGQDLARLSSSSISAETEEKATQLKILQLKQSLGDSFDQYGIDFNLTLQDNGNYAVQAFIVTKALLSLFGQVFKQLDLEIVSVESLAQCLTLDKVSSEPYLILWGEDYLYLSLVVDGFVYDGQSVSGEDIYKQINSLISSNEQKFDLEINTLYIASKKIDMKKLKTKGKQVEEVVLDPFAGSAVVNEEFVVASEVDGVIDEDSGETAEDESNNEIGDESLSKSAIIEGKAPAAPKPPRSSIATQEESMDSVTTPETNKSNAKLVAVILTVVVVLVGMVIGGFFVYQNAMKEASEAPEIEVTEQTPVVEATPAPESTPEASQAAQPAADTVDLSELSVEVLNGSGTPGLAGKVANLLEDAGFDSIDTGNADSFDFEETVIQVKPGADSVYESALTAIQDDYEAIQGEDLESTSEYDMIVTVGKL